MELFQSLSDKTGMTLSSIAIVKHPFHCILLSFLTIRSQYLTEHGLTMVGLCAIILS